MPRFVSLTFRTAARAMGTDVVPIVLAIVTHPELDAPLRLSSDPTVRTSDEPLTYGTHHQGQTYDFVLMGAQLPDDVDGASPSTSLTFENVDKDMVGLLRSITTTATIELRLVLSTALDVIEEQYLDFRATLIRGDADKVTVDISREYLGAYNWPYARMTASRFPGLHR